MSDLYQGCPEPEYVVRGNRVKCAYCGLPLKTRGKYIDHFRRRHMNDDGTWRVAEKRFLADALTDDEQEALDSVQHGEKHKRKIRWL